MFIEIFFVGKSCANVYINNVFAFQVYYDVEWYYDDNYILRANDDIYVVVKEVINDKYK